MKLKKKFMSRIIGDKADGVLVMGIISMMFFILVIGFAIDMSKNSYTKQNYITMSQLSAETSVKTVNSRGSLNENSVKRFITEYEQQRFGSVNTSEASSFSDSSCSTSGTKEIDGAVRKLPYYSITLSTGQRRMGSNVVDADSVTYTFEGVSDGKPISLKRTKGQLSSDAVYTMISGSIYDSNSNIMLSMFGKPCQYYQQNVSSIKFSSNEDVK